MKIIELAEINSLLDRVDAVAAIEEGFIAYSAGKAVVPPVGELLLDKGEVHIKYGYIRNDDHYVIKVASGYYENARLGLPTGNGLMLLFKQATGELESILLDQGLLTDIRTAAAGAVVAKHLAPKGIDRIGIIGTGVQARLQLKYLRNIVDCREVIVCGRGERQLENFASETDLAEYTIETTLDAKRVAKACQLIVTTTPSHSPLIFATDIGPGTHITAVGSDTKEKQELDAQILLRADLVVADSIFQCLERGEIYKALSAGLIDSNELVELGDIIRGKHFGRTDPNQITIADLTGVAVQDIKIAEAVYLASKTNTK